MRSRAVICGTVIIWLIAAYFFAVQGDYEYCQHVQLIHILYPISLNCCQMLFLYLDTKIDKHL